MVHGSVAGEGAGGDPFFAAGGRCVLVITPFYGKSRLSGTGRSSRIDRLDLPARAGASIEMPLVKAIWLSLPKFDALGQNAKTRPELRTWDVFSRKLLLVFPDALIQCARCFEWFALT